MRTQVLILNLAGRPAQPFIQRGLAVGAVKGLAFGFTPPQQFNQWHRIVQDGLHSTRPLGTQQIIGILPLWHQGKPQGAARLQQRHRQINQTIGRPQSRLIPIQRNDGFGCDLPHHRQLIFGNRSAQWRNRPFKSSAYQCDHVHVSFGNDQGLTPPHGRACRPVIIQATPLIKQNGFGGVQIFCPRIRIHRATAKGHAASARIANGKHNAATEPIITGPTVIGFDDQSRVHQLLFGNSAPHQCRFQTRAIIRGKADFELLQRLAV